MHDLIPPCLPYRLSHRRNDIQSWPSRDGSKLLALLFQNLSQGGLGISLVLPGWRSSKGAVLWSAYVKQEYSNFIAVHYMISAEHLSMYLVAYLAHNMTTPVRQSFNI